MALIKKKPKEKIDFKYNFSVYFSFLKKYKIIFIILLFVALIMEASRAVDKFLFKEIIDRGTEFAAGTLDKAPFIGILIIVGGIFLGLTFFKFIFHWVQTHLMIKMSANMIADLKRKYFNHILSLSHNFHTTHKTGSLISRIGRGASAIDIMNDVLVFNITPLIFQLIVLTLSLIYFSWMSIIVVFATTIVFLAYSLFLQGRIKLVHNIANKKEDKEKGNIADFITNIDSIKYFGKETLIKSRFKRLSEATKRAFIRAWNYFRWLDAGQSIILGLGTFFIVYFPLLDFLEGKITLGTLVFIYTIYGNIYYPLFSFVHGIRNYYRAMVDFQALFQYGKIENEIKEKPNAQELQVQKGEIEFKNASFRYGKRNIFDGLNLKIPQNKKIALVGHSGSGKTTFVKLLYRLYDLHYGQILIDGKDIRDFKKESLRSEMSIVPQEAVLFDDTVYNNVAFSNPKASKEEVLQAIKFAQLDKIIKEFPKKEKTIVGERGVKLSGGEKQRVSIARALLANKKILVLDEATSSLDSETEAEIQLALENLMKGRTTIIIAHRLSTIMKADEIIVLKKGDIIQRGKHKELIKQDGEYKKLWNLQKGGYIK